MPRSPFRRLFRLPWRSREQIRAAHTRPEWTLETGDAGFVRGIGAEYHTFGVNPTTSASSRVARRAAAGLRYSVTFRSMGRTAS